MDKINPISELKRLGQSVWLATPAGSRATATRAFRA